MKPQAHLINILKDTCDHHPNFALLLGAGASVTSGVPAAGSLIDRWRKVAHRMYASDGVSADDFLRSQHWFQSPTEYAQLFEMLYDQPGQRREFIESCVKNATPSWGYIYLVNLLRYGCFNTVFTTNFDDLLNEACYLFSRDVRPMVCAHDSSISSVRITSQRPKIIKLHGDFLFDNIRNTVRELESLESNMKDKLGQYSREFGLIVVGYSGSDRSVMDTLNTLLRTDTTFPHGVYWCVRRGSDQTAEVLNLLRFPRVHLVEIDGFDEFFAETNEGLGFSLQDEMTDPYRALTRRLNGLVDSVNLPDPDKTHRVIERDIARLAAALQSRTRPQFDDRNDSFTVVGDQPAKQDVPYRLLAEVDLRMKRIAEAESLALQSLMESPDAESFTLCFKVLEVSENQEFETAVVAEFKEHAATVFKHTPWNLNDSLLRLTKAGRYEIALQIAEVELKLGDGEEIPLINYAMVLRFLGREPTRQMTRDLEFILRSGDITKRLGAAVVLGRVDEVLPEADPGDFIDLNWPIWDLMPTHPREIFAEDHTG